MNSLECVKYVCRVGVVSEVEFHVCCCPSIWTTRLNKLAEEREEGRRYTSRRHKGRLDCPNDPCLKHLKWSPSPRDQWRNLWRLLCLLTLRQCWRGLWKDSVARERKNYTTKRLCPFIVEVTDRIHLRYYQCVMFLTLKLASISLKALVFPLRAVQTRLKREERMEKEEL